MLKYSQKIVIAKNMFFHIKSNRHGFGSRGSYPYVFSLMRYSGFLPLKYNYYDEEQPISVILIIISIFLIIIDIVCFGTYMYAFITEKHNFEGSLLIIFQSVHLTLMFQGIANNILMILKIKKMTTTLKALKKSLDKFKFSMSSSSCFITAFTCVILAIVYTVLTEVSHCKMVVAGFEEANDCYIQVSYVFPNHILNNILLYGLILTMQNVSTVHCLLMSLLADVWVMRNSKTLVRCIQKWKTELILLKSKSHNFTKEFDTWNAYYKELKLLIRNTTSDFSFLLLINVACNSGLLCLSLYWTIIQLRVMDAVLLLFPLLLLVVQFVRMTLLSIEGSNFEFKVYQ